MPRRRFRPNLDKTPLTHRDGYRFYSVCAFAVRNAAEPDEEFGTFATRNEFPDLIPEGEVWVSDRLARREGEFLVANALARLAARAAGAGDAGAYTAGLAADRTARARATGIAYRAGRPHRHVPDSTYARRSLTLPDEQAPIAVWRVDGCRVRCTYKTDYVEGGHGYVYPWVPRGEIWVERDLDEAEVPFILAHEYTELRLMRDAGMSYDRAHEASSRVEFDLRKPTTRAAFPGFGRRRPGKADLPHLTAPEYFEYVTRHYLRGRARRAAAR